MWKATIRGLFVRKIRLALTAMAVLLGVSFVAGTYVLTDTLDRSFQGVFDQSVEGIDAVVRLRPPFGGDGDRERFPESLVTRVRDVAGVRSATGFVQGYAQFVGRDGEAIQVGGAPTFGISWAQRGRDGPLRLIDADGQGAKSRPPRAPGEVAMDAETARRNDFSVGDRVDILTLGPKEQFRIVGLFGFGSAEELGAVTFAAFDLSTAQAAVGAPGLIDAINVTAQTGTNRRDLRARLAAELGGAYEISSGRQVADDRGEQVLDFLALLTQLLLGFAAIGLVVGAFIIFNTFTILVAQRTRELGLLRAMGASRRQVIGSVIGEAAVVGVVASDRRSRDRCRASRVSCSSSPGGWASTFPRGRSSSGNARSWSRSLVGLVVTVVSAIWPALRASRVPPVAAINDVGTTSERSLRARGVLGVLIGAAGIPFVALGLDRTADATNAVDEIWVVAVGALLVFFGVVVLLATFARPLASALGAPFRSCSG